MGVKLIKRPKLTWLEKTGLLALLKGFIISLKHFLGHKVTVEYPEEKWQVPLGYRGAPYLVKDHDGNTKCVACQLCEYICPSKAIKVTPPGPYGPVPDRPNAEKMPIEFKINMLRCIFCGLCEEVCPEGAIFLSSNYVLIGTNRGELQFNKIELLGRGGKVFDHIQKWKRH